VVAATMLRRPHLLLYGAAAVVLGAGLASFYLIPAAYEEKWVNIAEVLAPGLRPQDNFLFTATNDTDHNRFNLMVSLVGAAELMVLAAALYLSRRFRNKPIWWLLAAWGSAAAVLMLPITLIFWKHLPELRFVQLPWRWLLCLNVAFALLVTLAFRRWLNRVVLGITLFAVLWVAWHQVQPPWWDTAADIQEMHDFIADGGGYEGTDEYVPVGVDPYELNKDTPNVATVSGGRAVVRVDAWKAESRNFSAEILRGDKLKLRLLNYPAWRVEVNGREVAAGTQPVTGEILIPVAAGKIQVRVSFRRTEDRLVGGMVSFASCLIVIAWSLYCRRRDKVVA
jgi:hypothetical protein